MDGALFVGDDFGEVFTQVKGDAFVAHVVEQGFIEFVVDEAEEFVASIENAYVDAQGGEHAGVFGADDTCTDEEDGFGEGFHGEAGLPHGVGIDDGGVVEGDTVGSVWGGASGDDNIFGLDEFGFFGGINSDFVSAYEGGGALD